jgi:hypothetical protein
MMECNDCNRINTDGATSGSTPSIVARVGDVGDSALDCLPSTSLIPPPPYGLCAVGTSIPSRGSFVGLFFGLNKTLYCMLIIIDR